MNEDRKNLAESQKIEHYDDEIELIDILRVIWKWKYLIIGGAVICGVIAAIISLNITKIYSIDMVLRPGILSVNGQGKTVYIDSLQDIKAFYGSGKFNSEILDYLDDKNNQKIQKELNFSVEILAETNTIIVKYETADIAQGIKIQNRLSKLLIKEYDKLVQHFKGGYDIECSLLKHQIDLIKATIQSYNKNVKNIDKRNNELISEINIIKNNYANLVTKGNKLLSKNPKENEGLQILFYTYLIQQNIALTNNYLNEINDYKLKKEEYLNKIQELNNEVDTHGLTPVALKI